MAIKIHYRDLRGLTEFKFFFLSFIVQLFPADSLNPFFFHGNMCTRFEIEFIFATLHHCTNMHFDQIQSGNNHNQGRRGRLFTHGLLKIILNLTFFFSIRDYNYRPQGLVIIKNKANNIQSVQQQLQHFKCIPINIVFEKVC